MYKFYLKSNTALEIVNIICIAVVTLTSDSELVLNKRRASKWSVIRVRLFSCHESCLCLSEKVLRDYRLSCDCKRLSYVFGKVNVSAHNRSIVVALFSDLYNKIVMKKTTVSTGIYFCYQSREWTQQSNRKKRQHKTRHVQNVPKHGNVAYPAFYKESQVDRNCL